MYIAITLTYLYIFSFTLHVYIGTRWDVSNYVLGGVRYEREQHQQNINKIEEKKTSRDEWNEQ